MNKRRRHRAKRRRKITRWQWRDAFARTYSERITAMTRLRQMGVKVWL